MNLIEQRAASLKDAQSIMDGAKAAGRELSADELKTIEEKVVEVKGFDERIALATKGDELRSAIGVLEPEQETPEAKGSPRAKSLTLGEHFVKSVGDVGILQLKRSGGSAEAPEWSKANTDPNTIGSSFGAVLTDVDQTVVQAFRRPLVSDLLGTGSISGTAVTYYVEGAVEGAFSTVAEGGQKPQLHIINPTPVTDAVKKIAGWFDNSDEMVEDLPFFASEINNRGVYLLQLAEETQLLNGDGTGTNLTGLLQRSGIQVVTQASTGFTGETPADAIFRALTAVQTATGLVADGIIINPADYMALRLSKDGNNQYYGGGYFEGQYGNSGIISQPPLWGVNTVVSAAVPAKTVVVGALKVATTVYRKGGIRVESTNSDQGKFTKNLITTRIEERAALAVRIPSAIVKVNLS